MKKYSDKKLVKGISWQGLAIVFERIIQLVIRLILVKFLTPNDFGIIGISIAFIGLIKTYAELGVGVALIQRKNEDVTEEHWSTAFWINLFINILGYCIILFLISPLLSSYYKNDIYSKVIPVIGLTILLTPIIFIQRIKIIKKIEFKKLFLISSVSLFISGVVSLVLIPFGFGIWCIVVQVILNFIIKIPFFLIFERWIPKYFIKKNAFKDIFKFGIFDILNRITGFLNNQVNTIILGFLFNPVIVGYYDFSNSLTIKVLKPLNNLFKKVLFPFFSGIQDNRKKIIVIYLEQIRYINFIILPLSIGLFFLFKDFLNIFYTEKWFGSILPMKYLSFFMIITSLVGTPGIIYKSIGKIKLMFVLTIIKYFLIRLPFIVILGILYKFNGFLLGFVISQILISFFDLIFLYAIIKLNVLKIINSVYKNFICSIFMIIFILLLKHFIGDLKIISFFIISILSLLIYISLWILLNFSNVKKIFENLFMKKKILKV